MPPMPLQHLNAEAEEWLHPSDLFRRWQVGGSWKRSLSRGKMGCRWLHRITLPRAGAHLDDCHSLTDAIEYLEQLDQPGFYRVQLRLRTIEAMQDVVVPKWRLQETELAYFDNRKS
jgi:hypothetical protein